MIQKKICLLGAFAVGKTSLVSKFVSSIFSEKYMTSVGVKVDKKIVLVDTWTVTLVIWDIYGADAFQEVRGSYMRGSAGFFLVADGTRPETLDTALALQRRAKSEIGDVPFVLAINKTDLSAWQITDEQVSDLERDGLMVWRTSAKTGEGVEAAFTRLTQAMLQV
jgi:small GTP-binding protein